MRLSPLRATYLGLAAWGAVHPMALFAAHMRETGTGLPGLLEAWGASAATRGLTWDLLVAALAFWAWALSETLVRRNWGALVALPVTLLAGLGCALPLYLFLRARPIA